MMQSQHAWQLKMFDKAIKKQLKVKALKRHIGDPAGKRCLLVTCGDNNGATNYHLQQMGGEWTWADFEDTCIEAIEALLGDKVHLLDKASGKLPLPDQYFDLVVSIDVHEHLKDPLPVTQEFARIVKDTGKVIITTPNGDEKKLAVRIKHRVGMTVKEYGHERVGFDIPDLEALLHRSGLRPGRSSSYSRFFTEMVELVINFAYVKILSKKSPARVEEGTIAPTTQEQLRSVQKAYRLYSLAYPVFWSISQFDRSLFFTRGYAVIVEATR